MSARWEREELLKPIAADRPCGESLEDTETLSAFDTYRLFGDPTKYVPKPAESPEWVQIRDQALDALAKSKDLRLLATLATALLRTDGVPAFGEALDVAATWLETWWADTYPRVDEDAILRRNALNCFADPMAVVDALRKVPLVASQQHGRFSLRDIDIATRQQAPGPNDAVVDENQVRAAFASTPIADLVGLEARVAGARQSLRRLDAKMREAAGSEATPNFDSLSAQLARIGQALKVQIAAHPNAAAAPVDAGPGGADAGAATPLTGAVTSRQDAIRALDAVADFFRRTEPSSPVPMFCARAKRLVSADFFEVLAEVVPDAVAQARAAGGLRSESE